MEYEQYGHLDVFHISDVCTNCVCVCLFCKFVMVVVYVCVCVFGGIVLRTDVINIKNYWVIVVIFSCQNFVFKLLVDAKHVHFLHVRQYIYSACCVIVT